MKEDKLKIIIEDENNLNISEINDNFSFEEEEIKKTNKEDITIPTNKNKKKN